MADWTDSYDLTPTQQRLLALLAQCAARGEDMPPHRDVAAITGAAHPTGNTLDALRARGLVTVQGLKRVGRYVTLEDGPHSGKTVFWGRRDRLKAARAGQQSEMEAAPVTLPRLAFLERPLPACVAGGGTTPARREAR